MVYQALYRRWRPQKFNEIIGQEHIVTTLTNALKTKRIAHAYLFSGPRGTGKTSTAKVLAKALNCQRSEQTSPEPCNQCPNCLEITGGSSLDVIEIDAASNRGIDEIRELREKARFSPATSRYKVYIIDEVHMLTTEAFNALLKILEEPPAHIIFILATTDPQRIPLTVLSRCQRFDFHRLPTDELVRHMTKICQTVGVEGDELSLNLIAKSSEGCVRDALSLLEQSIAYCGQNLNPEDTATVLGVAEEESYFEIGDLILAGRLADCILFIDRLLLAGKDLYQFTSGLIWHFRNLLLLLTCGELGKEQILARDKALEQSQRFGQERLFSLIELLSTTLNEMKFNTQPRISLELALVQLIGGQETKQSDAIKTELKTITPQTKSAVKSGTELKPAVKPKPDSKVEKNLPFIEKKLVSPSNVSEKEKTEKAGLTLAEVQRNWQKVLKLAAQERTGLFAFALKEGKLIGLKDNCLRIGFSNSFNRDLMEKVENKHLIAALLDKVLGKRVQISCTDLPESGQLALEKEYLSEVERFNNRPAEQTVEENDSLVNGLLTMFSGEIVTEEDNI